MRRYSATADGPGAGRKPAMEGCALGKGEQFPEWAVATQLQPAILPEKATQDAALPNF